MAKNRQSYHDEQKQKNAIRLRELMLGLPLFMEEFFRGISQTTSSKTRIAYAYDLIIFYNYITSDASVALPGKTVKELELNDLKAVTPDDLELYMEYLTFYTKESTSGKLISHQNDGRGKMRKMAAIRSMYNYFIKKRKLTFNPAELIDLPKIQEKNIIRLEASEITRLLDEVESGSELTERQKKYHEYTSARDLAIITLLLGTGIRVSECVGININDVDFNINGVKITRKGGNETVVYFGLEVHNALRDYLRVRLHTPARKSSDAAFFLSMQGTRINVRTVQYMVKKYTSLISTVKNISPHKLRSTYGTNLYKATGDIYLVADVLGHKDVNTTRRHYAQLDDDRRKAAAKYIKLRDSKLND